MVIRNLIALTHKSKRQLYRDNLCLFHAMQLGLRERDDINKKASQLFKTYYGVKANVAKYKGFKTNKLYKFEKMFSVNVNVFTLKDKNNKEPNDTTPFVASIVRESTNTHTSTMNCSLWKNHFSYITNVSKYARRFKCDVCDKIFETIYKLKRHKKQSVDLLRMYFLVVYINHQIQYLIF